MILLDASALIDFLNRTGSSYDKAVEELIINDSDFAISEITLTEVLQGIRNERDYREVRASLTTFPVLYLKNHDSYIKVADLYEDLHEREST